MIKDYNIYVMSKNENLKYYSISLIIAFILTILLYNNPLFILIFIPIILIGKREYTKAESRKRLASLMIQFKDFLFLISTSFALGRTLEQAMEEALNNLRLVYGQTSYLVVELTAIIKQISTANASTEVLLEDFAKRTCQEDIMDFSQVYSTCRRTGGDMIKGVNSAAEIIGDKITIEDEIKAAVFQRKLEGRLIGLMPFIIILFLKITSPDYIEVMYCTLGGRIIMSICLIGSGIALYLVERITRIEI